MNNIHKLLTENYNPNNSFTNTCPLFIKKYFDYKDIWCVLEDRKCVVDMWRGEGLTCLQVAPGDF